MSPQLSRRARKKIQVRNALELRRDLRTARRRYVPGKEMLPAVTLSRAEAARMGRGTRKAISRWPVKYAIVAVLDQTIGYWTGDHFTIHHPEARLFRTFEEAEHVLKTDGKSWYVEFVFDEAEFRAREDTW